MYQIAYLYAPVTRCDYIGRSVAGVCAVVMQDNTTEVFRSQAHVKRIACREEAEAWIKQQSGE